MSGKIIGNAYCLSGCRGPSVGGSEGQAELEREAGWEGPKRNIAGALRGFEGSKERTVGLERLGRSEQATHGAPEREAGREYWRGFDECGGT